MNTTLLHGVTVTGESTNVYVNGMDVHTVQVVFTNTGGSVTALTVDLEGSLDNTTWFTLKSYALSGTELTAKTAMYHVVNKGVNHIRANITTITETGTTAVTVKYMGVKS